MKTIKPIILVLFLIAVVACSKSDEMNLEEKKSRSVEINEPTDTLRIEPGIEEWNQGEGLDFVAKEKKG